MAERTVPSWSHRIAALFLSLLIGGLVFALTFGLLLDNQWVAFLRNLEISVMFGIVPAFIAGLALVKERMFSAKAFVTAGCVAVFIPIAILSAAFPPLAIGLLPALPGGILGGLTAWVYLKTLHQI